MTEPSLAFPRLTFQTLSVFSAVSVATAVLLMVLRITSAVSFAEPLQLTTSGWEQETLFPIWKSINGLVVYSDPYKIPFAATFYNWVFIEIYATFSGAVLSVLSLEDAWLPTVGRFLTLAFLFGGTAVAYGSFLQFLKSPDKAMKILSLSFAVFIFFGPLMGFWGFTVRSDIGALLFEILVVYLFWKFYPRWPYQAVLLCAVAGYCAWGFKQVNVVSTVTIGLYFLYQRDWKPLFLLAGVLMAAYAATFLIGGPLYFRGFYESSRLGFSFSQFATNIMNFTLKVSPYLAALAALVLATFASPRWRRAWLDDKQAIFVLIGLGSATVINLLISTKVGSADNYYFVLSYFMALASLKGYALVMDQGAEAKSSGPIKGVIGVSMLGWAANIVAVGVVLFGVKGIVSVTAQHDVYSSVKKCAEALPKPVFIPNTYLSLPWMNPGKHHFVVSYSYSMDRRDGLTFERGGLNGLITEGYFGSLLLNSETGNRWYRTSFDDALLDGYKKLEYRCQGFVPYVRRKSQGG